MIKIRRVYDPSTADEGVCFLVDRLWPRGVKREALHLEAWLKEVAPSNNLRLWYNHETAKWEEFCQRYFTELDNKPDVWLSILEAARKGNVTLLYSTREIEHNNAVALKLYLDQKLAEGRN